MMMTTCTLLHAPGVHHGRVQPVHRALQPRPQGGGHPQVLPLPHRHHHGHLLLHSKVGC